MRQLELEGLVHGKNWTQQLKQIFVTASNRQLASLEQISILEALGGKHLGTPTNQEVILPSLTPFATERFLLLRQIVVNCFNLKEINSVHLSP